MTTKKFKIMSEFIKDMSSETPNVQTYLFVRGSITKYHLNIEITSKALKDKIIEIDTTLKFLDSEQNERKANFEMIYTSIVKIEDSIKDKSNLQKIILCEVQKEIYPRLEKSFLNMLSNSGYSNVKFDKKLDFEKLYQQKFN